MMLQNRPQPGHPPRPPSRYSKSSSSSPSSSSWPASAWSPRRRTWTTPRRARPQLACKALADAAEAYLPRPEQRRASTPPNSTTSCSRRTAAGRFLKNGNQDTQTPWPNAQPQYTLEIRNKADGSQYAFVHCTSDDGTQISQFGIGQKAQPTF